MSTNLWTITSHTIPASHIRGFPRGIRDEFSPLRLAIKQYTPKNKPLPSAGSLTVILTHGVGSTKESYEPLFDELLLLDLPIRGVWAMDAAHHGASYLLNESTIGDEPHWFDNARDLNHMINHFQDSMPSPIVGISQSWGCHALIRTSVFHPRLFAGLIMMEPTLTTGFRHAGRRDRAHTAALMAKRRDIWPSREDAARLLRKTPYYGAFDQRVFERVVQYDLRDIPPDHRLNQSPLLKNRDTTKTPVTLTTPKFMELATMMRPEPPFPEYPPIAGEHPSRALVVPGFYRSEVIQSWTQLPLISPSILYVWASDGYISNEAYRKPIIEQTGMGDGGNGGVASGAVQEVWVAETGHPVPLEKPEGAARVVEGWLRNVVERWRVDEERRKAGPDIEPWRVNPKWMERIVKL